MIRPWPRQAGQRQVFVWDTTRGVCGVTDDRDRAIGHVHQVLQDAPVGARGTVQRVELVLATPVVHAPVGRRARALRVPGGIAWLGG